MSIEKHKFTPDCKEVLEVTEIHPPLEEEMSTQGLVPPYNLRCLVNIPSAERLEVHYWGSKTGNVRWIDGFDKEQITGATALHDSEGNVISYKWKPTLYGENGESSSPLIPDLHLKDHLS